MAFVRQQGIRPQPEQLLPPPQPPDAPRLQTRIGQPVDPSAPINVVPTGSIDSQAGVVPGLTRRKSSLAHYAAASVRPSRQRYVSTRRTRGARTDREDIGDEYPFFLEAVDHTVALLSADSGRGARDEVDAKVLCHLPLSQRLNVLAQALHDVRCGAMPARQQASVVQALETLMTAQLHKQQGNTSRGPRGSDDAGAERDPAFEALPPSVSLRVLIGAKDHGKVDTPLSPLTVLKALIKHFGANVGPAMRSLRSHMMSGL